MGEGFFIVGAIAKLSPLGCLLCWGANYNGFSGRNNCRSRLVPRS